MTQSVMWSVVRISDTVGDAVGVAFADAVGVVIGDAIGDAVRCCGQ